MLTTVTTTKRNRAAYAKTLLLNTNRITDFYEGGTYATASIKVTDFAALIDGDSDDTLEVAGVVFTFQSGSSGAGTATIQAATTNAATATDIAAQINGYTGTGAALDLSRVTAAASGASVTFTADIYGTAANSYTLVYTDLGGATPGVGLTVSGSTLLGGLASTSTIWYNERKNDRRDKADEYKLSTTYPTLKKAVDSSDIQNARIELTTTKRNNEAFVKTLNINIDDIVKVIYLDADESYVYLARGAFAIDEYRVTHTRAQILAKQNAIYKRGVVGTNVVAVESGDADFHKAILTLSDVSITVANASEGDGAKIYTMPEGFIYITRYIIDIKVSSNTCTDTPEMGIGHIVATGVITTLDGGSNDMESVKDGVAISAITPLGTAVNLRAEPEGDFGPPDSGTPYDGTSTAMPIFLNFADAWGAAGDVVINGTITFWYQWVGDD